MNENNITAQLRDIKPLLEIPDSSYYLYWGIIIFGSLLLVSLVLFVAIRLWKNRKINLEKGYLEAIRQIDWKDSKTSAYETTHYARLLATDAEKKVRFEALEAHLIAYKYKKSVGTIDDETRSLLAEYIEYCHG
ncbi:MAG: hypothetical protein Q9M36_13500 [Sulfurovum sp.]|nr:hypothetical protein [Sulfurovum sp.]